MGTGYDLPDRVERKLAALAGRYGVKKLILFGSRARGENTKRSDVDPAVFGGDFEGFYFGVRKNMPSLLTFDMVEADNGISEELKKEIDRDGVVLYEKT